MKWCYKVWIFLVAIFCGSIIMGSSALATLPGFDPSQMSDMSDFDPATPIIPSGDTIKIGLVEAFSGPSAAMGHMVAINVYWAVHDLNKRGGIFVDGKMKKIQVILGNSMGKPAMTKKAAERLILKDKVDILWGTSGSHTSKIMSQVAKKYKTIYMNPMSLADSLHDGNNFSRYTFRTTVNTTMVGKALAYFYAKRPETKFYILNQDYGFGHAIADAFKKGLKTFKPGAEIVGEVYHPLFSKDFAPYITQVKSSGAEVIFTGDWDPDASNLIRQARRMGVGLPFANIYADDVMTLKALGPQGGVGQVNANDYMISVDTPTNKVWLKAWNDQWKRGWGEPYDTIRYKWPRGVISRLVESTYWLLDVVSRAGSTDPEKIIKVWEGDKWVGFTGTLEMRACDHQVVRDIYISEFIFPNKWFKDAASYGKPVIMPRNIAVSPTPKDLKRCRQ